MYIEASKEYQRILLQCKERKVMFQQMTTEDYQVVISFIAKINRSARNIFIEGYQEGKVTTALIYKSDTNEGYFGIIEREDYIVVHLSFQQDLQDEQAFAEIQKHVEDVIARRGEREIYLNGHGDNSSILSYFQARGFVQDSIGYEFRTLATDIRIPENQLAMRKFEKEQADLYLELIDEAFAPLDRACHDEPNAMRRNRDTYIEALEKVDSMDNFRAFWLGNRLIGVYLIKEDILNILAVHPEYQNKGYGEILMYFWLDQMFNTKKLPEVYLYVMEKNQGAYRFYKRHGFEQTGYYVETTYNQ